MIFLKKGIVVAVVVVAVVVVVVVVHQKRNGEEVRCMSGDRADVAMALQPMHPCRRATCWNFV
jgi:preprotein translocase subunit SecG